jgi:hypothetical protein
MTIRIRYSILNARLAPGALSGGGVDQAYDGWRVVSRFEFQQWGWNAAIRSSRLNDARAPEAGIAAFQHVNDHAVHPQLAGSFLYRNARAWPGGKSSI